MGVINHVFPFHLQVDQISYEVPTEIHQDVWTKETNEQNRMKTLTT